MRYHVCIALPSRLAREVLALVRRVEQAPFAPHITLVGPGEPDRVEREAELVRRLRHVVRTLSPCPVAYDGVACTGRKDYFYAMVPLTPWLALWQRVCDDAVGDILMPGRVAPARFEPHITLATRLSASDGERLWGDISDRELRNIFTCREFLLMRQSAPGAAWQCIAHLRLGGGHPGRRATTSASRVSPRR